MPVALQVLQEDPPDDLDNSVLSTHQRCPRKAYYQYVLNRAPTEKSYPIQWGIAYHKFREILERCHFSGEFSLDIEEDKENIFDASWGMAISGWEDPPLGHKKEWMTKNRLRQTCVEDFDRWLAEKARRRYIVLENERAFVLTLPSGLRYGGRFDQIVKWNNKLWVRDFKTTSRMGRTYALQFDPDNQMTGYIWAARQLSGRPVSGVIIEVVYNTKTKGPEFHRFLSTRTDEHIEHWIETVETDARQIDQHLEMGIWPMRTVACNDYGGCYFRECCSQDGWYNIEQWLLNETVHSVWDFTNPDEEVGVVD